ncbi:TRAP transporter substrate-binding protein DctP [Aidingimonas lacisalsi]|uniref:TRAP transporter substrate-binding protein DctP n=1 Tax=Aidingimonas lacisalsi TaxID=2604086 RepID=UPI0011D201CC|nr:TRAP transporter substrate-binding protein DctP [Aidingimonas lacisalsi]
MKLKTTTAILLGTIVSLDVTSAMADTLKISHLRPQDTEHDKNVKALVESVTSKTDDIDFRVFPANSLGDYTTVQERISVGAVEMALQPISSSADKKLQIGLLPYLASDWDEATEIFGRGSAIREAVADRYQEQNIKVLAGYPVYFGGISLNREPVEVDSVDDKGGIKLRVPPFKTFSLLGNALGYISSPLPFSEAFTSIQTGVVDGAMGAGAEGYYNSLRDVTEYYIPQNTHFEFWYLLINDDTFEGLNKQAQSSLLDAAKSFESQRWEEAESSQELYEKRLEEAGTVVVDASDELLEASAKAAKNDVWPEIISDMGEDWATPILEEAVGYPSE